MWDRSETERAELVEVATRGPVGLQDKVSLCSHFGLQTQTEGNICVNLSTSGSPPQRGMQRAIERGVGTEWTGGMSMLKKKKRYWSYAFEITNMYLSASLLSAIKLELCSSSVTVEWHTCFQARSRERVSWWHNVVWMPKARNKSKLIYQLDIYSPHCSPLSCY